MTDGQVEKVSAYGVARTLRKAGVAADHFKGVSSWEQQEAEQ